MTRTPIRAAYEQNGALDRDCPQCDAGPQQWCVDPRGRLRRVPCVLRTRLRDTASPARTEFPQEPRSLDFSEPRHPNERTTS